MPAQDAIDADPALVDGTIADSFTGPARFLQILAPVMARKAQGLSLVSNLSRVIVDDTQKALRKKRNTLYTKWIWWPVMTIIKLIPEPIFKKMSI